MEPELDTLILDRELKTFKTFVRKLMFIWFEAFGGLMGEFMQIPVWW